MQVCRCAQVQSCIVGAEEVQSRYRAGAEQVQRRCRAGDAEVQRCRVLGEE